MNEGWRAYLGVEVQFAEARLAAARASAEKLLDLAGGVELYGQISLRLAVVRHHLKRPDEAAVLFRLAATLNPTRVPTVAEFAPDVVAAYTAAVGSKPPTLSVRVDVNLPGGRVGQRVVIEVDGKPVPVGKTTVSMSVGQHIVVARAERYRSRGQVFVVAAQTDRVSLGLSYDPAAAATFAGEKSVAIGTGEKDARVAVSGVVRYAELDTMLFVASVWRRGSPALLGQACAGLPVRCGRVVELRYPKTEGIGAAVRELWRVTMASLSAPRFALTLLADLRLVEEHKGSSNGTTKPPTKRWWQSSWLWIGASVAATAVGTAWLLSRDTPISPVFDVRPCEFGGCP